MSRRARGDTIVEVIVAFAVFALLAVSTTVLMNRSLSIGQRSLEMTLVRQQVDSQAELLRYVRNTNHPAWDAIKADAADDITVNAGLETCPTSQDNRAFVLRLSGDTVTKVNLGSSASYQPAAYYSRVAMDEGAGRSYGLWVKAVKLQGAGTNTYDMYIQACWDSVGSSHPQTVSTIVRLYDT